MKLTDNSKLMNRLITNKLRQDSFSYLSYLYPISQFCQLPYSDLYKLKPNYSRFLFSDQPFKVSFFINLVVSLLVCRAFFILHWTTPFNQLFFSIRSSCLYRTIPQDLSATLKIHWIIQLALDYLDLLPYTEPAKSLTILYGFTSEP